jgi:hypothetical protein
MAATVKSSNIARWTIGHQVAIKLAIELACFSWFGRLARSRQDEA